MQEKIPLQWIIRYVMMWTEERGGIMLAIQILFAIALAIVVLLLLRFIMKRLWLFHQLKRFAKEHNYACAIPRSCMLPYNRNHSYVQIRTPNTVYNIKLFGLLRKNCEIHFWSATEYSTYWYSLRTEFAGATPICQTNHHRHRSLGKADWLTANGVPVLLISPVHTPVRLTKTDVNHFVNLRVGEKIGDAIFADLDYLFRHIENRENT